MENSIRDNKYDLIIIGAGASGIIAGISAARESKKVLILEKMPKIAMKLKTTGGGKCNLTNTLLNENFISAFGKNGRFMTTALEKFDWQRLREFFDDIGVETHYPDGTRVFPISHNSQTIIDALEKEMNDLGVDIVCNANVQKIITVNNRIEKIQTTNDIYECENIIVATGGYGYPTLGTSGDGHRIVKNLGHKITEVYPAMMPLNTKEDWTKNCTADTIPKVSMCINIKKYKKHKAKGDLIFTKTGIAGPVVLDFAREITPLFDKYDEIPLMINFIDDMNENKLIEFLKKESIKNPQNTILKYLEKLLPKSLIIQLAKMVDVDCEQTYKKLDGIKKVNFIKILCSTPLTIIKNQDSFKKAMITRGGISLKEIDPNTMKSKIIDGLYFCGEIVDLDGPCGGFNLQWAFSSGCLAGKLGQ